MNTHYVIPLFVGGSLLLTLFTFFLIAYLLVQKNKQNKYQLEQNRFQLEKRQMVFDQEKMVLEHEKNLLAAIVKEKETTMNLISKELHDDVKSVLGFAQMSMYNIEGMATDSEQAILIEKTNGIIGDVIDKLHNISHSLNNNFVLNIGLVDTISKELESARLAKSIRAELEVKGEPYPIGEEKEVNIFRIAQEALQNCIKHANATSIIFTLEYAPQKFVMKITDDGKGFEVKPDEMKGLGFLNMFQRAGYVQGALEVRSAPMQGSTIILTLNPHADGINS